MGFGPLKLKLLLLKDGISVHDPLLKIALVIKVGKDNVLVLVPLGICFIFELLPITCYDVCFINICPDKRNSLA